MLAGYLATRTRTPQRYASTPEQTEAIRNFLHFHSRGSGMAGLGPMAMLRPWYSELASSSRPEDWLHQAHGRNPLLNELLRAAYNDHDAGAYAAYLDMVQDQPGNGTSHQRGLYPSEYLLSPMRHLVAMTQQMHQNPEGALTRDYGNLLRPGYPLHTAFQNAIQNGNTHEGYTIGSYVHPLEDLAIMLDQLPNSEFLRRSPRSAPHEEALRNLSMALNRHAAALHYGDHLDHLPGSVDTLTSVGDNLYSLMRHHVAEGGQGFEVPEIGHAQDQTHQVENHAMHLLQNVLPSLRGG